MAVKKPITIQGIKLHKGQQRLLNYIQDNPDMTYFTINCSRQWGKTTFLIQLCLWLACNDAKSNTLICSPTYSQSRKIQKTLINGIKSSGIIKKEDREDNSIELVNGSTIYFRSVQVWDNLRGLSIRYELLDECAMYRSDEVFYGTLRPMMSSQKNHKCFLFSTPKGKNNFFYSLAQLGQAENEPKYGYFVTTYKENEYADLEEILAAKKSIPEALFRQEYEAEFVDNQGDVFSNITIAGTITGETYSPSKRYFAGIDLAGTGDDWSVLTIVDSDGKMACKYRNHHTEYRVIVNDMVRILRQYNPVKTLVEVNGVGSPIYAMLKEQYAKCTPWVTSNSSKQEIIEALILAFQDEKIQIFNSNIYPELTNELQDYTFTFSRSTHSIQYNARSGNDDTVMSLALAWRAYREGGRVGHYTFA